MHWLIQDELNTKLSSSTGRRWMHHARRRIHSLYIKDN